MRNSSVLLLVLFSTLIAIPTSGQGQSIIEIIAVTGDQVPDGNGIFRTVGRPSLNNSGQVAFAASLSSTSGGENDNAGVFRGGRTTLEQIARKGDIAPDSDGVFSGLTGGPINDAGQVAFLSRLTDSSNDSGDGFSIFRANSGGELTQIVRVGSDAPDGNGTFATATTGLNLNNDGQVVFRAALAGTRGGASDDLGVYLKDDLVGLVSVAREGTAVLDGDEILFGIGSAAINNSGQIVLVGRLAETNTDETLFLRDSAGNVAKLAQAGDVAPNGNGFLSEFDVPSLNNAGQVAVIASLTDTREGENDSLGVFQLDKMGNVLQVARAGDLAPDDNGRFRRFSRYADQLSLISQNDRGEVVFYGLLTETSGLANDSRGLFLYNQNGSLVKIVRGGDMAPDGNGQFIDFDDQAINSNGQIAFTSLLTGTIAGNDDNRGIYFYDSAGLTELVREGKTLLESEITDLGFISNGNNIGDSGSGLNNHGQVAFKFTLADGREGIAIATPVPEPSALLLGLVAAGGFVLQRRGVANHRHA